MALWSNTDANTSAPKFVGVAGVSANGLTMYANTQTGVFIAGANVGIFGVDSTEQGVASNQAEHGAHAGWNLVKAGTGGRANRIHVETLIAMGSMTGDGSATANDDTTYADS